MGKKPVSLFLHCQQQLVKKLNSFPLKVLSYYKCPFQIIDLCSGIVHHNRPNPDIVYDNTYFLEQIPEALLPLISHQNIMKGETIELQEGINIFFWDDFLNVTVDVNEDLGNFSLQELILQKPDCHEDIYGKPEIETPNSSNRAIQRYNRNISDSALTDNSHKSHFKFSGNIDELREQTKNIEEKYQILFMAPNEFFKKSN